MRALQLALHPPAHPTPTLSTYFQEIRDQQNTGEGDDDGGQEQTAANTADEKKDAETVVGTDMSDDSNDQEVLAQTQALPEVATGPTESKSEDNQVLQSPVSKESNEDFPNVQPSDSIALVLPLTSPSDVCSAVLFYRTTSQSSTLALKAQKMVFYPSFWMETTEIGAYVDALRLLDQVKDDLGLEAHAITIPLEYQTSKTAMSRYMQESVLSSREVHDVDRAIYVPSPGLVLDVAALVEVLHAPIAHSWTIASPPTVSSMSNVLLFSGSSTFIPTKSNIVVDARTPSADEDTDGASIEASLRGAAYLLFDADILKEGKSASSFGRFIERYREETKEVCEGLDFKEEDYAKSELKRREEGRVRERQRPFEGVEE